MKLSVKFDEPHAAWIGLYIDAEDQHFFDSFSYTPNDSFDELISALIVAGSSGGGEACKLHAEPTTYVLEFSRSGDIVTLNIQRHPDYRCMKGTGTTVMNVSGSYADICLPFWRALRSLQGKYSVEELERRWQRPFPYSRLEWLTKLVKGDAPWPKA